MPVYAMKPVLINNSDIIFKVYLCGKWRIPTIQPQELKVAIYYVFTNEISNFCANCKNRPTLRSKFWHFSWKVFKNYYPMAQMGYLGYWKKLHFSYSLNWPFQLKCPSKMKFLALWGGQGGHCPPSKFLEVNAKVGTGPPKFWRSK